MEDYRKYIISKGGQELGLLDYDIKTHLLAPSQYERFKKWMGGQTVGVLEIADYDETVTVTYVSDYLNFINGGQVTD